MQPMTCIQPAVQTSEVKQLDSVGACDLPDGAAYTILRACVGVAAAMEALPGQEEGHTCVQPD